MIRDGELFTELLPLTGIQEFSSLPIFYRILVASLAISYTYSHVKVVGKAGDSWTELVYKLIFTRTIISIN